MSRHSSKSNLWDRLFGYDQGVMGGLLTLGSFLQIFPEINVGAAPPAQQGHVSTIQGITIASYNVGTCARVEGLLVDGANSILRLFLRRYINYMDR